MAKATSDDISEALAAQGSDNPDEPEGATFSAGPEGPENKDTRTAAEKKADEEAANAIYAQRHPADKAAVDNRG